MFVSPSMRTETTSAGLSAFATKPASFGSQRITSMRSPPSSLTTFWMRAPRTPTTAPIGSIPSWREITATLLR